MLKDENRGNDRAYVHRYKRQDQSPFRGVWSKPFSAPHPKYQLFIDHLLGSPAHSLHHAEDLHIYHGNFHASWRNPRKSESSSLSSLAMLLMIIYAKEHQRIQETASSL
mmetsp:Transcript_19706/g.78320  ORF Transcript_19706/g.78320 Transcript_19706/m.78320 type:complete len:109 (+) Transcript_19706:2855-3181(+)